MHHDVKVRQYLLLPGPPLLPALTTNTSRIGKPSLFAVGGTQRAHLAPGSSPRSPFSTPMLRLTPSYPTPPGKLHATAPRASSLPHSTIPRGLPLSHSAGIGLHNVGEHPAPLLCKAFTITQPVAHMTLY
jgi:hypothetical protein